MSSSSSPPPRANRQYLCIASVEGGVEIEEVAKTNPDAVAKIAIDPGKGVDEATARAIVAQAKFPEALVDQAVQTVLALWKVFVEEDATLVEVNPLARLTGDRLEALDGKVSLDDNADFRHAEHADFELSDQTDPLEAAAKEKNLNYVKLDGEVGIIGNGAGLVMSTLDVVAWFTAHGAYRRPLDAGKHAVSCPWIGDHSTGPRPNGSDSVVWERSNGGWPTFHCSHDHCAGRSLLDVIALWRDADSFCAQEWRRDHG